MILQGTSIITNEAGKKHFKLIENYIYLYHLDKYVIIPVYPDNLVDNMGANFQVASVLSRSAQIYSYSSSGPRTVQFTFTLHRDMMSAVNTDNSSILLNPGEDYVDFIVSNLQACVVPEYGASSKMVNPPVVAVRIGDSVYIKGIINGQVGVTYNLPILQNNKYAMVNINFQVTEIDPYSASEIATKGSFRGLNTDLTRNVYVKGK